MTTAKKRAKEVDVKELVEILKSSHTKECWQNTQNWFNKFEKNYEEKASFFERIMYAKDGPYHYSLEKYSGVASFNILQGDVVKTMAAMTHDPEFDYDDTKDSLYIVIPSSCSIQPQKYKWVLLARLYPLDDSNIQSMKSAYYEALNLKNNRYFYLPSIQNETSGEYGYLAVLEEISYIENSYLQTCARVASLSTLGWHLFNAFIVNHFTRPSGDDLKIRDSDFPEKWSLT